MELESDFQKLAQYPYFSGKKYKAIRDLLRSQLADNNLMKIRTKVNFNWGRLFPFIAITQNMRISVFYISF